MLQAAATVTLSGLSQTYDGTAKPATVSTTPNGLAVTYTYNGSSTAPTAAGTYTVVGTINDTNYQGSATGPMTIAKATASVTLGGLSHSYDGTAKSATVTTNPVGLAVTYTYNGSSTAPTAAGTYAVVGTINDTNYQGSALGTMTIAQCTATVTLCGLSQTCDGTAKSASATTSPVGLSVSFTYNGTSTAPTAVGTYTVVGTINDANYQGSAIGTMTIATSMLTITASAGTGGSITPGTIDVVQGASQTFAIAPASGYAMGSTTVDGTSIGAVTSYTFSNVQTAHTLAATFIPTITATAGANGNISPPGVRGVTSGVDQTYTIIPKAGYHVDTLTVDGSPVTTATSYTFINVTTPHTISVTFAQNSTITITVTQGANGSITPGTTAVVQGTSQTFAIAPASGYAMGSTTVDGTSKGALTSYTFSNVQADHTIAAAFIPTITATAGANGNISPPGVRAVTSGADQTYTIIPKAGYHVDTLTVDGSPVTTATSYTFINVTTPHTILVTFAQNSTITITVTQGANGSITPGTTAVVQGTSQTFAIAPASGYAVGSTTVDGTSKGALTGYTFSNVQADHTIAAAFIPTITATAGANGNISPPGVRAVTSGVDQTYTIIPKAGYHVDTLTVDGSPVTTATSYTFINVTTPHTISVTFAQNSTITITVTQGANGSITPGTTAVVQGTSQTFAIAPASGYAMGSTTVDGTSKGALTGYTFSNVQADHTIAAAFIPTITATAGANGNISPPGVRAVTSGADQTYTIIPKAGYHVDTLTVDGSPVTTTTSYTFINVTTPHTILVTFAAD